MQRVKRSTAVAVLPAAPAGGTPGFFAAPDPAGGVPATVPGYEWYNTIQEELVGLVLAAGIALHNTDSTQLFQALIQKGMQGAVFNVAVAAGTSNEITGVFTPAIAALSNGMSLYIRATSANTTTTPTFTPASGTIAAKTIVKGAGAALAVGDIAGSGHWIELQYDLTLDKWVLLNPATGISTATVASVQGAFKNLKASATGLNATVTVSADEIAVEDSSNAYKTLRSVSLSINSAGTGENGLDTGSIAASTWYSVWAIYNPTTQTMAGVLSLSATAPTMPIGYTHKARVGWIRTDSTANKYPLSFKQYGRRVQYALAAGSNITSYPTIASGTAASLTAASTLNVAPTTAASVSGFMNTSVLGANVQVGANSVAPQVLYTNGNVTGYAYGNFYFDVLLESQNIYWAAASGGATIAIEGWEDNL